MSSPVGTQENMLCTETFTTHPHKECEKTCGLQFSPVGDFLIYDPVSEVQEELVLPSNTDMLSHCGKNQNPL